MSLAMSSTEPTGTMIIGGEPVAGSGAEVHSYDPRTGEALEPAYRYGDRGDVERAAALADEAFETYRATDDETRARFLDDIADRLDARRDVLAERAHRESGLPLPRVTGEVGRTSGQLRLFAGVLREGGWHDARVDPARPDRTPAPRADIRSRRIPLGPVAVFGASNFPLAFSVAGGDTASALAAGCPVVVKAHDAHLGTCELVAAAVSEAVVAAGLPAGVFSLLVGDGPELGTALVTDPRIAAVGFTGSRRAGLALVAAAASRPCPIPVFAEMSSVNPVLLLPGALAARGGQLGTAFVGSLTMGAGQFCTNPGLVVGVEGAGLDAFVDAAATAVRADPGAPMLSAGIARAYADGRDGRASRTGVQVLARGGQDGSAVPGTAALLGVDADAVLGDPALGDEIFGATALVVRCRDVAQLRDVVGALDGQLTATVHADATDHPLAAELLPLLERRVGRILFDGWPTGVEVGHAMVHGGPFPATSDPRGTSVGSTAIERFLRPVAYQDVPDGLLPPVLRDGSTVPRRVDGRLRPGGVA